MADVFLGEERRTVKSLSDLIQNRFGARTDYRTSDPDFRIADSPTKIFSLNPKRFGLVIVNMSASRIFVAPDEKADSDYGWVLVPNGGSVHFNWLEDFQLCELPYWGTGEAADLKCFYLEVFCI